MHISDEGELEISLSKSIRISKIDESITDEIEKNEKPPRKIHYIGECYYLEEDSAGYFCDLSKETEDWEELVSWEYLNDEATKILTITQWDIRNIEASAGLILKNINFQILCQANSLFVIDLNYEKITTYNSHDIFGLGIGNIN